MPNEQDQIGRQLFSALRAGGCELKITDDGLHIDGEHDELKAQIAANAVGLSSHVAQVMAVESRANAATGQERLSFLRYLLNLDPRNDLAIAELSEGATTDGHSLYACLRSMGLNLARSTENPEHISISGDSELLASVCGKEMQERISWR